MGDFSIHVEAGLVRSNYIEMDVKKLFELGMSVNLCGMRVPSG